MKKILLLSMLLFNIAAFSQSKEVNKVIDNTSSAIEKVYSDGSKIVNKAYDASVVVAPKIESALKSLGTELKVGADKVWTILVKQQLVWSICFLILTIVSLVNWFIFYKRYLNSKNSIEVDEVKKTYREGYEGRSEFCTGAVHSKKFIPKVPNQWFIVVHLILCITFSFFSFYNFTDMLTGFINPEFGAMKTIATIASQIK